MQRLSGLNMEHAEDLEIVKYRPGGFHTPHVDYYIGEEDLEREAYGYGNR